MDEVAIVPRRAVGLFDSEQGRFQAFAKACWDIELAAIREHDGSPARLRLGNFVKVDDIGAPSFEEALVAR